jgi:hypothetical protein
MVVAPGDTVMEGVKAPLLQEYPVPPEAVKVADAPEQMAQSSGILPDVSVQLMDGLGLAITFTVPLAVSRGRPTIRLCS